MPINCDHASVGFAKSSTHATPCELRRLARKQNLETRAATKQPDGQITRNLSSPLSKNIPLNPSGKSVI
jgi:hypothetical protein